MPEVRRMELEELRLMVRRFVDERCIPLERQIENGLPSETWRELRKAAAEIGLTSLRFPAEVGGGGGGMMEACVLMRELGRTSHSFMQNLIMACDTSLLFGTPEQQAQYLTPALNGEVVCAMGMTEPEAGSEVKISSTAERVPEGWKINGRKVFTTLAPDADVMLVVARTGNGDGHDGLSVFLVPKGSAGLSLGADNDKMGYRGASQSDVYLDDCIVPADALLGEEGDGWRIVTAWSSKERLMQASWCLGSAERCLELAMRYSTDRVVFDNPIFEYQAIQWMIAESVLECSLARKQIGHAAILADNGDNYRFDANCSKLFTTEMAARVIDRCLQIFGGLGYMRDLPFDMLLRDVRLGRIGGGTSEMMKIGIAKVAMKDTDLGGISFWGPSMADAS